MKNLHRPPHLKLAVLGGLLSLTLGYLAPLSPAQDGGGTQPAGAPGAAGDKSPGEKITRIINLKYAAANDVLAALQQALGDTGRVVVDKRTNALVITATRDGVQAALEVAEQLDVPAQTGEKAPAASASSPAKPATTAGGTPPATPAAAGTVEVVVYLVLDPQGLWVSGPAGWWGAGRDYGLAIQLVPSGPGDGMSDMPGAPAQPLVAPPATVPESGAPETSPAVAKARALLEGAKAKLERLKVQYKEGLVTQGEVDDAQTAFRVAEADLAASETEAKKAKSRTQEPPGSPGGTAPESGAAATSPAVAKAQALLDGARAKLRRMKPLSEQGLVAQSEVDDAETAVRVAEADLAAAEAEAKKAKSGAQEAPASPAAGAAGGTGSSSFELPTITGQPPDVDWLSGAASYSSLAQRLVSDPRVAFLNGPLPEPKRAALRVGGPAGSFQIDWPENAPHYYLERSGNGYRKVELADRAGYSATLTPTDQQGVTIVLLDLTHRIISGGEYDADIGLSVGPREVLQTTCTASAPVVPGLTTVVTWRLPDPAGAGRRIGVGRTSGAAGTPTIEGLFTSAYGAQQQLVAASPVLQIRIRMAGARTSEATPAVLAPGDVVPVPPSEALAFKPGGPSAPPATGYGGGRADAEGPAAPDARSVRVWRALFELEVGSPEWKEVNEAADAGAKLLSLRDEKKVTPKFEGWEPPPLGFPGMMGGGMGRSSGGSSMGGGMSGPNPGAPAGGGMGGGGYGGPSAPATGAGAGRSGSAAGGMPGGGGSRPAAGSTPGGGGGMSAPATGGGGMDGGYADTSATTWATGADPATGGDMSGPAAGGTAVGGGMPPESMFESIEGENISIQVHSVFRVAGVDADLIGLAVSCLLKRAALDIRSHPDKGMMEHPAGMTIQFAAHPVLRDRQHACFRGLCFLRFKPDGYGVKDVVAKEAFLVVVPYLAPPGGEVGGEATSGVKLREAGPAAGGAPK